MSYVNQDSLVSTEWLADHLNAPDVRIVDATSFLPGTGRNAKAEYRDCHIPGAVFFDIDDVADETNELPHMIPSPEKFSSRVRKLGLGDGNRIVVYDANGGGMAACRVWWMFRLYGHEDVSVLDGGLPKWIAEGRQTDDLPPVPKERHFTPRMNNFLVRTVDQLIQNCKSQRELVVDARSAGRFAGTADEPREGLRKGHMPGSVNLPFNLLMDKDANFTFRSADEIKTIFDDAGIDFKKPLVASCGSGVTACVIAFAGHLIGESEIAVYDGSWTEWGSRHDTPIDSE
ncbi:MAG: 3-mercaptopyruvate sulfurtransferase [Rhodospirillales bacterium]|nr:3-mercaptopyruvate sulfurtransferase [Rhodospirillales bacterium]MBO6786687.1 3-mercaptopyruvate sulfurtransferase [Rhodospirillales bacterium]